MADHAARYAHVDMQYLLDQYQNHPRAEADAPASPFCPDPTEKSDSAGPFAAGPKGRVEEDHE